MVEPISLALPRIAALWGSCSAMLACTKELNDKRDQILSGKIGGKPVTLEHRKLLLSNDWLPLASLLVYISLAFALTIFMLPHWLEKRNALMSVTCYLVGGLPFGCGVIWIVWGGREYRLMKQYLKEGRSTAEPEASTK